MIILLTVLTIAVGIAYYLVMIKPDQNEKISKKTKSKGKVVAPVKLDESYAEIIDHYPTYDRQLKK